MRMQRRNIGDNYWNPDWGSVMESPPPSKLFSNGPSSSPLMQPSLPTSSGGVGGSSVGDGCLGYIEHTVTKFDTLAGVAIKYGVEVADIKKMNGLTTDLQMFARKTLYIPLPGRHPPSPIMSNGHNMQGARKSDMLGSIKSLKLSSSSPRSISPSMDALRDYYGLKPTDQNGTGFSSIELSSKPSLNSHPPLGLHRKCKSLANGMSEQGSINGSGMVFPNGIHDSDTWYDRWMRRRRSEIDLQNQTPEMMLNTSNTTTGAFAAAGGKGLALRPTAASRTASDAAAACEGLPVNMAPLKLGESLISETASGVKKSSSSPSFHDMNGTSTSSIWPTSMLNLTADLQASTAAITRPIFDGLPKPMSGRKNKAAID